MHLRRAAIINSAALTYYAPTERWLARHTDAFRESSCQRCPFPRVPTFFRYWIAVTLDGITFCALDDSRTFQRSFSYSVKAKDRLLRWGAKDPLLQFIVQAFHHDKDRRKEGRIPMSVALDCDHAIDVAYMVHNISTDSFRLLHEEEGEEHNDGEGAEHKKVL